MDVMDFWISSQNFIEWNKYKYQICISIILCVSLLILILRDKRKLPPGPYGLPFIGYFPFIGTKPYEDFLKLSKKYGNVFSIKLGQSLVVILNDWESMKEAFSKSEIANRPESFSKIIPNGLGFGSVNGAEWVEQRRFCVKVMKDIGFGRTRWEELVQEELVEVLKLIEEHGTSPLDVREFFASTFTNNVMTLVLGERLPVGHPDTKLVSKCVDTLSNSLPAVGLNIFLPALGAILTKLGLTRQSLTQEIILQFSNYTNKMTEKKIVNVKEHEEDSFVNQYFAEIQRNKTNPKTNFTETHLRGNTQALFLGGSETSRRTLNFILIAMAEHQEEQKRVQSEIDSVLGKDGWISWANRTTVPYTYAVMLEAMRWKSVLPVNAVRQVSEDIKLSGYDVPKGAFIISNHYALHNDPKYWENPEKFLPERFLLDDGKQINFKADSYVPFSYGKRSCPGELIAMMQLLLYFVKLMQKFQVLPENGHTVKYDTILGLTLQATNFKLRFIPRE